MRKSLPVASSLLLVLTLLVAVPCGAVNMLQLDILGGTYDSATDTIIAPAGDTLTLVALLTPHNNASQADIDALLAQTYYVSAALLPSNSPGGEYGSFEFDEQTVEVTADMTYGVPPIEWTGGVQGADPGDLPTHSIFPAYFKEFSFQFVSGSTTETYNSMDDPGGWSATAGDTFYRMFTIDTTALSEGFQLHFDLYDTTVVLAAAAKKNNQPVPDIDVDDFAPFSHDAETNRTPHDLPEPGTLLLLGASLLALAARSKRD